MGDETDRQELQEYLRGLEEERRKVEAFKRELPLCMQLLTDGELTRQLCLMEWCSGCCRMHLEVILRIFFDDSLKTSVQQYQSGPDLQVPT